MSVRKETLTSCKVKLHFTLEAEDFNTALDAAFEKKVKEIDVPGFRKGKLPRAMFNKRFGEESLYDEAINLCVNKAYAEYLEKSKLQVVNYPELDVDFKTLGRDKKLKFTIDVEVWPTVELGQYKEVEIEKEKVEVTDKDVEDYIARILSQHGELEIVEGEKLAKGHTAVFDFEGSVDGKLFDGGKAENYSLVIGSGQFIPGFEDQMVGMEKGEEKTITVKFPEEYGAKELAGKDAQFKINLHEIKKHVDAELTDEFVKDELEIKDVKTVAEYKVFVKDLIEKDRTEAANNKFSDDLLTKVVENAKFDLPNGLVDEEVAHQVQQVEAQAKAYGLTAEQLLQYTGMDSMETYKKTVRPSAEINVKQRVVLFEIAKVEKLKVTAKEYNDEIKQIAKEMKATEEEAKARYTKDALTPFLQLQKAIKLIKDSAIVK